MSIKMDGLTFEIDEREKDAHKNEHRRARFRQGWQKAVANEDYTGDTLKRLTWDNLGYRLGKLFGETSPEEVNHLYDWCVRQHQNRN